jgi:hypothetical protein
MIPQLESLFAGLVFGLALFALLACAQPSERRDRPVQTATAGPR